MARRAAVPWPRGILAGAPHLGGAHVPNPPAEAVIWDLLAVGLPEDGSFALSELAGRGERGEACGGAGEAGLVVQGNLGK